MSLARAQTQTAHSRVEHTSYEATAPPTILLECRLLTYYRHMESASSFSKTHFIDTYCLIQGVAIP